MKMFSTKDVAQILGVTTVRVNQLIQEGKLPAQKIGRDWFVREQDLVSVQNRPGRGRPSSKKG